MCLVYVYVSKQICPPFNYDIFNLVYLISLSLRDALDASTTTMNLMLVLVT